MFDFSKFEKEILEHPLTAWMKGQPIIAKDQKCIVPSIPKEDEKFLVESGLKNNG